MAGKGIKGITIEIGGETTGLQKALQDVNKRSRDLQSELKQVDRLLKFDPGNAELVAQKQELLAEQVVNTTKKLDQLGDAQAQVKKQFQSGEIGADQYRAFQREIVAAEGKLKGLKGQLDSLDGSGSVEKVAKDVKELGDKADKAEGKLSSLGSGFKTAMGGIVAGVAGGAAAIGGLVTGMEDMNKELARLRTNASNAGFDLQGVESGFEKIAAVTGETDSAVETMSNLMATGFSDQQLTQVIDDINGAYIRFSDTLKTEGIADGLQETLAVGEAVGPFAELLERSGVSLDTFNAGLAQAAKNGTETDFVLQQLSELGLSSAYEEYQKLNPEIVAQQEAQMALKMALSELSVALTPLVTMVTEFLTKIIEWGNENLKLVQSFGSIGEGLAALLPQLAEQGIQIITNLLDGIAQTLPELIAAAQTFIPKIIEQVASALPGILNAGIDILLTLVEGIAQVLPTLINSAVQLISTIVSTLLDNLPKIIDSGVNILKSLIQGISNTLPNLISTALKLIVDIAATLIKNLPKIIEAGVEIIGALIAGIVSMAIDLAGAIITDIIPNIVDTLSEIDLRQIGKDIIQGLINGITDMADALWEKVKGIADSIKDTIADALDMHSPSRVMMDLGKNTVLGLTEGIDQHMSSVTKAANGMAYALQFDAPSTTGRGFRPLNVIFDVDGETLGSKLVDYIGDEIVLRVGR